MLILVIKKEILQKNVQNLKNPSVRDLAGGRIGIYSSNSKINAIKEITGAKILED